MTDSTPARQFGLGLSTAATDGADPVAAAISAEESGFDFVSASDHPCGDHPTYETWTMLAWIAAHTSRIRVASRVLGVQNRPPAVLAKMAETLDRLSEGRLILGLGAGHSDDEFRAFGLDVRTPGRKIVGLEEALRITRGLWERPTYSLFGSVYRVEGAQIEPKPAHRIPIWLGMFAKRGLDLTGRLADGWIPTLGYASAEDLPLMRQHVIDGAIAADRDPAEVASILNLSVELTEEPRPEGVISGTPARITDQLAELLELGFDGFNFIVPEDGHAEHVEALGREVLPNLRTLT
jgi:alkanesulfonate monooxygenase SsuD/methylene tetrahydromethanopterin reductase-like flavin-dependent oxidoreductase (luciferase family)